MRILSLMAALAFFTPAGPAAAREPDSASRVAVVVVTLDQVRQVQTGYGASTLDSLRTARGGRFELIEPALAPEVFASCRDERIDGRLDYCIRYYLTRAELPADGLATVVVALDDQLAGARDGLRPGAMRATCFGRGTAAADAAAQDIWLWPGSARLHGVRDWNRDRDALAACIAAAASEPWTGLREPDVD